MYSVIYFWLFITKYLYIYLFIYLFRFFFVLRKLYTFILVVNEVRRLKIQNTLFIYFRTVIYTKKKCIVPVIELCISIRHRKVELIRFYLFFIDLTGILVQCNLVHYFFNSIVENFQLLLRHHIQNVSIC